MYFATALLITVVALPSNGVKLTGRVVDEKGRPIDGALVDIYTAKPRVGIATTCPSCYRDCAKSTKTDDEGQFGLGKLSSGLSFRLLVMAPGKRSHLSDWIDPVSDRLEVKLEPIPRDLPNSRLLTGRILDAFGRPLVGAVVSPTGAKTTEKRWWGSLPGVDEASITDPEGRFIITSREPKLGIDLKVAAPGFADFPSQLFDLDGQSHEIRMQPGASIGGKLTFDDHPIANRSIGIVQQDRSPQSFVGERVVATDKNGGFLFVDLQPNQKYFLYTLCENGYSLADAKLFVQAQPVLQTQSVTAANSGESTDMGELKLIAGAQLAGKVSFPAELPNGVKIRLNRDPVWDWIELNLDESGEFGFYGLPPEVYSIRVLAPGFEIDASKFRFQMTGESRFALRIPRKDKLDTKIQIQMRTKTN